MIFPLTKNLKQFSLMAAMVAVLLLGSASPCQAHGGVTPYDVLGKMKRQGTGPYSKIMKNRRFSEDWLGIQGEDTGNGVRIMAIKPNGVAEEASFLIGDIIIGINAQPIRSLDELDAFMYNIEPEVFTFHYLRDNEESSENIYLDGSLAEVDPEMTDMLRKQQSGGFKPGMLKDDMMARSPMGSMKRQGFVPPLLRSGNNRKGGFIPPIFQSNNGKKEGFTPPMMNSQGGTMPMDPSSIMRQMMSRTPLGNFSGNPASSASPLFQASSSPPAPYSPGSGPSLSPSIKSGLKILEEELLALPRIISRSRELGLSSRQVKELKDLDSQRRKFFLKNDSLLTVARMDLKDELNKDRINPEKAMEHVTMVNDLNRTRFLKWLELWDRMNKTLKSSIPKQP